MSARARGLVPGGAAEAGFHPGGLERAFALLERAAADGQVPGGVALVGRAGVAVGPRAFGRLALVPSPVPARPDAIYDLASVTKPVITTTLALQALDEGLLRLGDPVGELLPAFGPAGVTVFHLLTHTSGLPAWRDLAAGGGGREGALARLGAVESEAPPGTRCVYSCLGFIALGELLSRVFGQDLASLARARVLDPVGMKDTGFRPPAALWERIAPSERLGSGEVLRGIVHDENARALGGVSGNAGLFGTAWDLGLFCQMLLDQGRIPGGRLLSPAAVELARRPHTPGLEEARGLGWQLRTPGRPWFGGDLGSPSAFGHTGFTGTSVWVDPERDCFAVLLTNRVHPTRENGGILRLRPLFHNAVAGALR